MKNRNVLKYEALQACAFRNHTMDAWEDDKNCSTCVCQVCGMVVRVVPKPQPNDIDISGNAVALNCKGKQ